MDFHMGINLSGVTVPVFGGWPRSDRGSVIGHLYNREAFCWHDTEDGTLVYFRNGAGKVVPGYYYHEDANSNLLNADIEKVFTDCTDRPYGTVRIGNETFYTFKLRRNEEVYTVAGTRWGTVAAGRRVACRTDMMDEWNPDRKGINYVESSDGQWVKVTGDGYNYGFVDTGLEKGATPTTISMYGSW